MKLQPIFLIRFRSQDRRQDRNLKQTILSNHLLCLVILVLGFVIYWSISDSTKVFCGVQNGNCRFSVDSANLNNFDQIPYFRTKNQVDHPTKANLIKEEQDKENNSERGKSEKIEKSKSTSTENDLWWSFKKLQKPALPNLTKMSFPSDNPIDRFIQAKWQEKQLVGSPQADRLTLIRRLTFDLHGLPPTPEQIEQFLSDRSPDAYEQLVKRLLASPRYGEYWGQHWLDTVPYADTHGFDKDKRRDHAWKYRDYVIDSFNRDKPCADWIREQLAGDILFPQRRDAVIATGFITAGPWDFVGHVELREGTTEKEKTRVLDRDDMLANTISSFMSLTIHCARCHDHKFDPISQADYYQLQSVFAGVRRGERLVNAPMNDMILIRNKQREQLLEKELRILDQTVSAQVAPKVQELDKKIEKAREQWRQNSLFFSSTPSNSNGYHSLIHPSADHSCYVQIDLGKISAIDWIVLYPARPVDFPNTPGFGFPKRFRIDLSNDHDFKDSLCIVDYSKSDFINPQDRYVPIAGHQLKGRYLRITVNRLWNRKTSGIDDFCFALAEVEVLQNKTNLAAHTLVESSESIEAGLWSRKYLVDSATSRLKLNRNRLDNNFSELRENEKIWQQLHLFEKQKQEILVSAYDANTRQKKEKILQELIEIRKSKSSNNSDLYYGPIPLDKPRDIHILGRGEVSKKKSKVLPAGLDCLEGLSSNLMISDVNQEGQRRVALAKWISSQDNPLTWRSLANRVWFYHFGKGIVDSPNDFGHNGALPTHPELLDYLADELRTTQSLKKLHFLIVTSHTYRQISKNQDRNSQIDGDNRFLWRMNRKRLDAEQIRDAILLASGKMIFSGGGPGFALFQFKDDHSPTYDYSNPQFVDNPSTWRRSVYRFVVRSVTNPFLDTLDCADPNVSTPKRNQTLTALQALALLNDPFILKQAKYLEEKLKKDESDLKRQIEKLIYLILNRKATKEEVTELFSFTQKNGLANSARLLWNLNEFLFVD